MSKNGKNLGTMMVQHNFVTGWYGAKKAKNFRFFTGKICNSGAEKQIMIDGIKLEIGILQLFRN